MFKIYLLIFFIFTHGSKGSMNDCGCAFVIPEAETDRIVGGKFAEEYTAPYQALILMKNKMLSNGEVYWKQEFCGGTILNRRYILTAANCIANVFVHTLSKHQLFPSNMIRVHVKASNKCNTTAISWDNGLLVEKVIVSPDFPGIWFTNDIGLVKLVKTLDFSQYIMPACLPTNLEEMYANKIGLVSGWDGSCKLKTAWQTILESVTNERCIIDDTRLCGYDSESGFCFGDIGGPLTVNENQVHVVVGVASYLTGTCKADKPDVFMRVSAFVPWIRKNIEDGDCANSKTTAATTTKRPPPSRKTTAAKPSMSTTEEDDNVHKKKRTQKL